MIKKMIIIASLPPFPHSLGHRTRAHACLMNKKSVMIFDLSNIHKYTIHLSLTLLIDKINDDYHMKKSPQIVSNKHKHILIIKRKKVQFFNR